MSANLDFLKNLVAKTRVELPRIERKPVEPGPRKIRDLKSEIEVDSVTAELFGGLREQQTLLRRLQAVREPAQEVLLQAKALCDAVYEIKAAIRGDTGLYAKWIAGPLVAEDELAVSLDLAERGVLVEVSQEEAAKNKADWQEYKQLQQQKEGDDEPDIRRPQTLFVVREITGSNAARSRFFVKRMIPQGEQFPDGYSRLMAAYAGHFAQKRAHYREMGQRAGEMLKDLGVEEGKTLKDVEAAITANTVAFDVTGQHEWKGQDGRPLVGKVVVKNEPAVDGIAKLQILGAVGSIFYSLRRHIPLEGSEGTVFAYKAGRAFEGMSKDTGEDQPWFRAFLAKVAGLNGGRRGGPSGYSAQFTPQTPRGERGEGHRSKQAKGRREKGERGGGKRRDDASRFDDGEK